MKRYVQKETGNVVAHGGRVYALKIRDLAQDEKPREKLVKVGPQALSMSELISVVLMTGTVKEGVRAMSERIMHEYGEKSIMAERRAGKLAEDLDIPLVKACQIVACGEIGRRFYERKAGGLSLIRSAKDIYEYVADMRSLTKEHLRGIYLNTHNRVIYDEIISIGTINANIVHPREVFRPAIEYGAAAVVLAHNHPSGIVKPSSLDVEMTTQLIAAGNILGIHLLDHVVVAEGKFESVQADYDAVD